MAYKYVFKYVFKGYDSAHMILKTHGEGYVYDEIERHLDFRYLTATEAAWRILGFWLQKKSHSVIRLALHEEGKHTVYYNSDEPEPPSPEDTYDTHLLAYFAVCRKHAEKGDWIEPLGCSRRIPNPNRLLYTEIPQHFRWDRTKHKWRRRLNSKIGLGRLPFISPAKGELFHLRTLLCHVRGPNNWNDLKTVYGEQYPTFKAACIALGLQRDDREADLTLAEAVQFQMPRQLRQLFATLLTYNTPADPHALWEKYKHELSQDFTNPKRRHRFTPDQAEQLTFWLINKICIQQNGDIDLAQLLEVHYEPLPFTLDYYSTKRSDDPAKEQRKLDDDVQILSHDEQRPAYLAILHAIQNADDPHRCFFLNGPGGSGKTTIYKLLIRQIVIWNKQYIATAPSGIAASNLPNGSTLHYAFSLPPRDNPGPDWNSTLNAESDRAKTLIAADVIFIDEISMVNKQALTAINILLRHLCNPSLPFGGKVIVVGGDFRQLLPVVLHCTPEEQKLNSVVYNELWDEFQILRLTVNRRARFANAAFFRTLLENIGTGNVPTNSRGQINIPAYLVVFTNLINHIYSRDASHLPLLSSLHGFSSLASPSSSTSLFFPLLHPHLPPHPV
jgi:hypothetical protein